MSLWLKSSSSITTQMKAIQQYLIPVVLYKVAVTSEPVDKNLKCGYSDESY